MRKFLIRCLLYILPVVVVSLGIVLAAGRRYWASRIPVEKKYILDHSPHDISLALGSSHAYFGINSRLVSPHCYNLASYSQCYYEDYSILKYALANHSIGFLVLPVSYFSNHATDISGFSLRGERLRAFDYEHAYQLSYPASFQYWADKSNLLTFFAKSLIRKPYPLDFDTQGNLTEKCGQTQGNISDSTVAFDRHNEHADFTKRNPYLDSIIHLCALHHIKLNVVIFPFTTGYNDQIDTKGRAFDGYIESLRTVDLPDYQILDCRRLFHSDESYYFINADHLSPCGRDSFSIYLSGKIIQ
ncbi:MAG: hypothetical protein JST90_11310 [Bacteroidetes bacterium]|nr:hypothetical protein [Bacteroidota bacterium]